MIQDELFALQDTEYAAFQSKLTPNISRESIIGVRVPQLRKLAKRLGKSKDANEFLLSLPHAYYDENMLHSLLVSEIKDLTTVSQRLMHFFLMSITGPCVTSCRRRFSKRIARVL